MINWSEISIGKVARKLYSKVGSGAKTAFLAAFVIGFFTHCFVFFNMYLNHDGIDNFYSYKDMTSSGRWLLKAACSLSGDACLPVIIGFLSLLYLSVSAALIVELFRMKNKGYIILMSAFIACFPAVKQTFLYIFTADGYMLSFLLAVAAVFVARRFLLGFLPASLLICLSLGIYQASVSVSIVLFMLVISVDILDGVKNKIIYTGIVKYLVSGALGCGLYFAVLKIVLAVRSITLSGYKGISSMTMGFSSLKASAVKAISSILMTTFRHGGDGIGGTTILNALLIILVLLSAALVLKRALSLNLHRRPLVFLLLPVFFVALPFAMCCILFVSPEANYYPVMLMSYSIVFAAVPVIFDRYLSVSSLFSFVHKYSTTAISLFFVAHFIICSNYTYAEMVIQTKNTEAMMTQIVSELYDIDGFESKPIVITCDDSGLKTVKRPNYMYGNFRYIYLGFTEYERAGTYLVYEDLIIYLKLYYGIDCTPMKFEQFKKISTEPAYKKLTAALDRESAYNIFEYNGSIIVVLNKMYK